MLVFRKELMLKRLERENMLNQTSDSVLKLMEELDGKEVQKNERLKIAGLEYAVSDNGGTVYPVNREDIEEVVFCKKRNERCI